MKFQWRKRKINKNFDDRIVIIIGILGILALAIIGKSLGMF